MSTRALTVADLKHLGILRDFLTEAARHHRAAVDAHGDIAGWLGRAFPRVGARR